MTWFKREKKPMEAQEDRRVVTEGLWTKCGGCKEPIWKKDLEANMQVCPKCGHHYKITAYERLNGLLDEGWTEQDSTLRSTDPALRWQRARDMATELRRLRNARDADPTRSLILEGVDSRPRSSRMLWLVLPALALGGGALYMRFAKRRGIAAVSRRLEVLDTARVGPKAHVVVISVGGRQLLLGVTEQSVQRLGWMSGESKVDAKVDIKVKDAPEARAAAPARAPDGPFAHILRAFTQGKETTDGDSDVALKIAAETKDTFERRSLPTDIARRELGPGPEIKIIVSGDASDVEEQVSGLRKRRSGKLG